MALSEVIARLSVVLGMDTAAFATASEGAQRDLAKLRGSFEKFGNRVSDIGKKWSLGVTTPLAAIGAAMTASSLKMVETAETMRRASQVAGEGFENFQRLAFGASTVGIEADKLGDIFKDVQDKIGDFRATGGGGMADFFENIAPKVGLTAEAFRGLSGKEGLQLYYDSLVKAGVSSDEMIFYLEAIASDASMLIPLLHQGGKAFEELGDKASVLTEEDADRLKDYAVASKEFQAAIQTLTIAIANSGIVPFITDLIRSAAEWVRWAAQVSPATVRWALAIGAVSAAIGPSLIAIGALTRAIAPLYAAIGVTLIPALRLLKIELAALYTLSGPAAAGMRLLTVALRGLLIATAVGAAILALVEAWRFFTRETGEAAAAAHAAEVQSLRTKAALDAEQLATDSLAKAKGKERAAQLDAIRASRDRAAQAIQTAKALQAEARASIASARLEARRRYEESAGDTGFLATLGRALGGAGGAGPTITPGTASANRIEMRANQAQRQLEESERRLAKAEGTVDGLNKAILDATSPVGLPKLASTLSDVGKAGDRASGGTKASTDTLQQLMDRLFPAEADMREANKNLGILKAALDSGRISAERYSDSVIQLWRNFLGLPDGLPDMQIDLTGDGKSIEEISSEISNRLPDALSKLREHASVTKVQVVKTFKDMADETMGALNRLASAISGGGFLGILEAVIGLGLQLGSVGAFGKNIAANINRPIGENANGTNFWRGGLTWVGERGPELVDLPRGSRVTPNNDLGRFGGGIAQIVPSPYFDVVVDGRVMHAAPGIAQAGAAGGVAQVRRAGSRALA